MNQLHALLDRYSEPCAEDCEHSQCPLLRELHAMVITDTLERARQTVKPIVDREREGEFVGDLMNMRLRTPSPASSPVPPIVRICAWCKEEIITMYLSADGNRYCSVQCQLQYEAETRRAGANWERAAEKGATQWPAATPTPVEQDCSRLDNWPIPDVLAHLASATEHLLQHHDCDEHGHETWKYAAEAARKHISLCTAGWQYVHERDAELIRKDGVMCEAHPGLEFGHDPQCSGPGMAWTIEGRSAIAAALSSRDTEIREVLEGLAAHQIRSRRPCWCPPDYGSEPHTELCEAARALYTCLQPGPRSTCTWTYDPDGYWQTSCDDQFCITEGSPAENRMRYCHYCGRRITTSAEVGVIDAAQPAP